MSGFPIRLGGLSFAFLFWGLAAVSAEEDATKGVEAGREIFQREWLPKDKRSHRGDGLGPVFNDTSCIACHNQGGAGGGGAKSKNVDIVTPFSMPTDQRRRRTTFFGSLVAVLSGSTARADKDKSGKDMQKEAAARKLQMIKQQRERLAQHHPGFRAARSVVLHRFGLDKNFQTWRSKFSNSNGFLPGSTMSSSPFGQQQEVLQLQSQSRSMDFVGPGQAGEFLFVVSQRNTTSLFGTGQIDGIEQAAILAAAKRRHPGFPEVTGRAAKLKDGQIGRFGWKAQKASLHDFVLTACATELGLEVPKNPQAGSPQKPDYQAPGLDLTAKQCLQLTSYVASLPAPRRRPAANPHESSVLEAGSKLFASVGCASCHTADLGKVQGIYSDLLVHDMGQDLGDSGDYGSFAPNATEEEEFTELLPRFGGVVHTTAEPKKVSPQQEAKLVGAMRLEWRTPPLWGVRDSAPYLHDGRAHTLEQAIAFHGGEASKIRQNYFQLSAEQRLQVQMFLKSLVAP